MPEIIKTRFIKHFTLILWVTRARWAGKQMDQGLFDGLTGTGGHLLQQREIFSSRIVRKGLFAFEAKAAFSPGQRWNRINLRGVKRTRITIFRVPGGFQRRDGENVPTWQGAGWWMQFEICGMCMDKMSCRSHRWDLGTLVSVSVMSIVSIRFYLYLLFTWLKLSGISGSSDLPSSHSASSSSLDWYPGHLYIIFSSPGHSPEQPRFSSRSSDSQPSQTVTVEDAGNRLGCWRFPVGLWRVGKNHVISKIFFFFLKEMSLEMELTQLKSPKDAEQDTWVLT